jgi:hypothetical protein
MSAADARERNTTLTRMRDALAGMGNPTEWLATNEAIPLKEISAIQVYFRCHWTAVTDVTDEEFDRYLQERPAAYAAARASLQSKCEALGGEDIAELPEMNEAEAIVWEDAWWQQRERLAPNHGDITELNAAWKALRASMTHRRRDPGARHSVTKA